MLKTYLCNFVAMSLLLTAVALPVTARQGDKQPVPDQIKTKIVKLGVGTKATIILKDGTKTKGYISHSAEDDFVIRDQKTNAATTIRYADIQKVEGNKGHSTARNAALRVGIGLGAFLVLAALLAANID